MNSGQPYSLIYAPIVKEHLRVIELKYHALIRQKIEEQLFYEPDVPTRNRKPLKRSVMFEATWEIRFGPNNQFRVLYDVDNERHTVAILAIGIKRGNLLVVGREEVEL